MAVAKAPSADVRGLEEEDDTFFTSEPFDEIDNNLFSGDDTLTEILDIKLSEEDNLTVPKETLETPSSIDILKETIKNLKSIPLPPPGDGDNVPNANLVLESRILESLKSSKAAQQKYYMVRSEIEKAVSRARLAKLEDQSLSMTLKLIGGSALTIGSVVVVTTAVLFGAGPFLTWLFSSGTILTSVGQNLLISLVEKSFYTNASLLTALRQNLKGLELNSEFYQESWNLIESYCRSKGKNLLQLESADWTEIKALITAAMPNKEKILETIGYVNNFQVQLLSMILSSKDITKVRGSSKKAATALKTIKNIRQIVANYDVDSLINLVTALGEAGTDIFTLVGKSNFIFKTAQSMFECATSTSANKLQRLLAKLPLDTLLDSEYVKGSMFNYLYKGIDKLLTEGSILTFRVAFPIEYENLDRPLRAGEVLQEKKYFYFITGSDIRKNVTGAIINTASNQAKAVVNMSIDSLFGQEIPEEKKKAKPDDDDDKSPKTLRIRELIKQQKSLKEIEEIITLEFPIPVPPEDLTLYPTDEFLTRFTKEFKQGIRNMKELYKKSDGFLLTTSMSAFITIYMGYLFDYSTKPSSFSQEYMLGRFRFYLFPIISVLNNVLDHKIFRNLPNHLNPMIDEINRIIKTLTKEILRYLFSFVSTVGQQVTNGVVYTLKKIPLLNKNIVLNYAEILMKGLFEVLGAVGKGVSYLATDILMVGVDRETKTIIRNASFMMKDISLDSIWTYLNSFNKYYNSIISGIVSVKGWLGLSTAHLHEFGRMILEQNPMHVMKTGVDIIHKKTDCDFVNYASNTVYGFNENIWKIIGSLGGTLANFITSILFKIPMANQDTSCNKATKATISLGEDMVITTEDPLIADHINTTTETVRSIYNLYFAAVTEGVDPATFAYSPEFEDFYKRLGTGITETIELNDIKVDYRHLLGTSRRKPIQSLDSDLFNVFKDEIYKVFDSNLDEAKITVWLPTHPGKSRDDYVKQEFQTTFPHLVKWDPTHRIQLDASLSDYSLLPEQIQEVNKRMFELVTDNFTSELRTKFADEIYQMNPKFHTNFVYSYTSNGEDKTILFIREDSTATQSLPTLDLNTLPEELKNQKDELTSMSQLGYTIRYINNKTKNSREILSTLQTSPGQIPYETKDLGENTDFIDFWRAHVNEISTTSNSPLKVKFLSRFDNASTIQNLFVGGTMKSSSVFMDINGGFNIVSTYKDAEYAQFTEEEMAAARQWFAENYINEDNQEEFIHKLRGLPNVSKTIAQLGRAQKRTDKSLVKAYRSMRRNIFASMPGIFNILNLNSIHSLQTPVNDIDVPTALLQNLLGHPDPVIIKKPATVSNSNNIVSSPNYAIWIQEEFNKLTNISDKRSILWYMLLSVDTPNFQKEITRILAIPSTLKPTDILKNPSFLSFFRNALNGDDVSLQPIQIGTFTISTRQLTDLKNVIQSSKTNLLAKDSKDTSDTYQPLPYIAKKLDDSTKALPINILAYNNNLEPLNDFIFIQHFLEEQETLIKAANNDFSKLPNIITLDPQKYIKNFFGLDKASEISGLKSQYDVILQGLIDNTRIISQPTISFHSIEDSSKCAETILKYSEAANKYVYIDSSTEERQRLFTFLNEWLSQVKNCISNLIKQQHNSKIKAAEELFTDIDHFDRMSSWLKNEWKNTNPRKKMTKEQIQEKWIELTGGALHIPLSPIDSQAAIHNFNITLTIFTDYTAARDQDFVDSVLEDVRTNFQIAFPSDTAFFTDSSQGPGGAPQGSQETGGTASRGSASGAGAQQQQQAPGQSRSTGQQTRQTTARATGQAVRETSTLDQKQILETSSNALDTAISEAISNILSSIQSLLNSLTSLTTQLASSFGGTPNNVAPGRGRGNSLAGLGTGRRTDERVEAMEDIQEQCFKYRDHYVVVGKDKIKITKPQGLPPNITENFLSRCPLDSAAATALETYLSALRNAVKGALIGTIGVAVAIRIICSIGFTNPLCASIFFWMTHFIGKLIYLFVTAYIWVTRVDDHYTLEINRMKESNGQSPNEQFNMGKYFLEKHMSTQKEQDDLVKDMTSIMMVVGSEFVFDSMKTFIGEFISLIAVSPLSPLLILLTPVLTPLQHILSLKESKKALYGSGNTEYNIKGRWIPRSNTHKIVGQGRFFVKQASILGEWAPFGVELLTTIGQLGNFSSTPGAMIKLDNIFNWPSFRNGSTKSLSHILGDYTTEDIAFITEYGDEGTPAQGNVNPWDVLGRFLNRMDKNTLPSSTYTNNIKTKIVDVFINNYTVNVYKHILTALTAYSMNQVCIDAFNSSRKNTNIEFEATINVYNVNGNIESTEKKKFITQFSSFPTYTDVNSELLKNISIPSDYQKIESFLNNRNQYNTEIKDSNGILLDPTQWPVKEFDPCELARSSPVKLNIEVRMKPAALSETSQAPPPETNKYIKLQFKKGELSTLKKYYDDGEGNSQIKKYSTQESQDNRYILPVQGLTNKSSSIFRNNTNRRILKGIQIEYQPTDPMGNTMWGGYEKSDLDAFERTLQENTRGSKTTTNILPFFNRDVLPPIIDPNRFNKQAFTKDPNGKIIGLNEGTYKKTLTNDYVKLDNFKSIKPIIQWRGYGEYDENPIWLLKRDVQSFNALDPHLTFDQAKQQFAERYNKVLKDTYKSTTGQWRSKDIDMTNWFEYNFIFSSATQHPHITVHEDHSVEFNATIISTSLRNGDVLTFNDDNTEMVEKINKSSNHFALD